MWSCSFSPWLSREVWGPAGPNFGLSSSKPELGSWIVCSMASTTVYARIHVLVVSLDSFRRFNGSLEGLAKFQASGLTAVFHRSSPRVEIDHKHNAMSVKTFPALNPQHGSSFGAFVTRIRVQNRLLYISRLPVLSDARSVIVWPFTAQFSSWIDSCVIVLHYLLLKGRKMTSQEWDRPGERPAASGATVFVQNGRRLNAWKDFSDFAVDFRCVLVAIGRFNVYLQVPVMVKDRNHKFGMVSAGRSLFSRRIYAESASAASTGSSIITFSNGKSFIIFIMIFSKSGAYRGGI